MDYSQFTKLYPLSKTLCFELKPVHETADYIQDYGSDYIKSVVKADHKRADDYKEVKGLIDDLHRSYIDQRLGADGSGILGHPRDISSGEEVIAAQDIQEAFKLFKQSKKTFKNDKDKKSAIDKWEKFQTNLRKQLVKAFSDNKSLFGKELIQKELPSFLKQQGVWEAHQELVESFNTFTTYFGGFHENRKNMYVADDKATSIANRAINENLPRFFDNLVVFDKLASPDHAEVLEKAEPLLKWLQDKRSDINKNRRHLLTTN